MPSKTLCRIFIHKLFLGPLGLHLLVWSELGQFLTNESSYIAMVRGLQPCVWSGPSQHETEGPWPADFTDSHWWARRSQSKFTSHYTWGTVRVCECKMDVKSSWIPTWQRMDHVLWSLGLFKTHLLEVGLTQNRETMALRTFTTNGWFYFIMFEGPHE